MQDGVAKSYFAWLAIKRDTRCIDTRLGDTRFSDTRHKIFRRKTGRHKIFRRETQDLRTQDSSKSLGLASSKRK